MRYESTGMAVEQSLVIRFQDCRNGACVRSARLSNSRRLARANPVFAKEESLTGDRAT